MGAAQGWLLSYLLNSVWQLPLLAGAGWLVGRTARRWLGVTAEHRVSATALVAAVLVPAFPLPAAAWWRSGTGSHAGGGAVGMVGVVSPDGRLSVGAAVGAAAVAVYLALVLYLGARLAWRVREGLVLRRGSGPVGLSAEGARSWGRSCEWFGLRGVGLGSSEGITGPVTVGVWRRMLLVPPGFLEGVDAGEREAAMAHECAHMRRGDFGWNVLYEAVSLPVAFHPVVWMLKAWIAESRELVCDELAAEAMGAGREYARSLLRLASRMSDRAPVRSVHAIGIFDANILERRVMRLMTERRETRGVTRLAVGAACIVLGVATCGTAMALRMEVKAPSAPAGKSSDSKSNEKVDFKQPEMVSKQDPVYPAQARQANDTKDGSVIIGMTIGTDGLPTNIHLTKSLRADYDESALTAVKNWRFTPATRNGVPVAVEMSIGISFQLYP